MLERLKRKLCLHIYRLTAFVNYFVYHIIQVVAILRQDKNLHNGVPERVVHWRHLAVSSDSYIRYDVAYAHPHTMTTVIQ